MKWRIALSADGTGYLVHVPGESKEEAVRAAKKKVARDFKGLELRVKSAERIEA